MSLIYGLDDFKKKLETCDDAGDVRIVYSVIIDQVAHIKKSIDDLREKIEEKEVRLAEANLESYKSAMVERIKELTGR